MKIPPLILLELRFRTIAPVRKLPHYHGPQWSALMRNALKPHLDGMNMAAAGVGVHPVETGVMAYEPNEPVHLGLTFPARLRNEIAGMLDEFNSIKTPGGHFQPGRTIRLEEVFCRISQRPCSAEEAAVLDADVLKPEIDELQRLDGFTLHLYSPLRLPRPAGHKVKGHSYCDEEFFLGGENAATDPSMPLGHLLNRLRLDGPPPQDGAGLRVCGGALRWLDSKYGRGFKKTIGGPVGKLKVAGRPGREAAERLVLGQYVGAGKNAAFGLGFYRIAELDHVRRVRPLTRGVPLLHRAVATQRLKAALKRLPNSSPGPDMLTVGDIKKTGDEFLSKLAGDVVSGRYRPGPARKYRMEKDDGTFREISVQNVADRLVHKAAACCLSGPVERLLSDSSYAYRRGLNRKGAAQALRKALSNGYSCAVKADVADFFGSVDLERLMSVLEGLFPFEPLTDGLREWLLSGDNPGRGLPQGSPLSPLLSNLYLDNFDRYMAREGLRIIRYGDDFVVLSKSDHETGRVLRRVERHLGRLGLALKHEKTTETAYGKQISFLGYAVDASGVREEGTGPDGTAAAEWRPVFTEGWNGGAPVYLTSFCRKAYSNGRFLVVKKADGSEEKMPWEQIGRLVIVGRSGFSSGMVYRAVREGIPVTFIDVMGRVLGRLRPENYERPELWEVQERAARDERYRLCFAREIVTAKVHNAAVLLRRNSVDAGGLKALGAKARAAGDMETLLGCEGAAAKLYFGEFARLVAPLEFKGRVYHPPDGPVNAMLSLGYSLLYNRLAAALNDSGFDPRVGLMHRGRGSHAALASDLLEELRHVAERVVLSLIHRSEITEEDFSAVQKKGRKLCRLENEAFRKYIRRFEKVMAEEASYNGDDRMSWNARLDETAGGLKRSLKLDIPYRALRIR